MRIFEIMFVILKSTTHFKKNSKFSRKRIIKIVIEDSCCKLRSISRLSFKPFFKHLWNFHCHFQDNYRWVVMTPNTPQSELCVWCHNNLSIIVQMTAMKIVQVFTKWFKNCLLIDLNPQNLSSFIDLQSLLN